MNKPQAVQVQCTANCRAHCNQMSSVW